MPDNAASAPFYLGYKTARVGKSPINGTFAQAIHSWKTQQDGLDQCCLTGVDRLLLAVWVFPERGREHGADQRVVHSFRSLRRDAKRLESRFQFVVKRGQGCHLISGGSIGLLQLLNCMQGIVELGLLG